MTSPFGAGCRERSRSCLRPGGLPSLTLAVAPLAGGSRFRVPPRGGAMLTLLRLPFKPVAGLANGLRWRSIHTPLSI
jgi:hypothetical protein